MLFFYSGGVSGGGGLIRTIGWFIRRILSDIRRTGLDIRKSLNLRASRNVIAGIMGEKKPCLDFIRTFERVIRNSRQDIRRSTYFIRTSGTHIRTTRIYIRRSAIY